MTVIDFLLNLAGLLLWLNWRSRKFDLLVQATPATLTGALRRADNPRSRGWHYLAALAGMLLLRALLYWQIGPSVDWVPNLQLGAIAIYFRSDRLGRIVVFSVLSFGVALAIFYLWVLFLSLVNGRRADDDPVHRVIRLQLGRIDGWGWPVKLLLPLLVATPLWLALNPLLTELGLLQPGFSTTQKIEQAVVIALGAYLSWKYLIAGLLLLWLVSTYVYLGNHVFWKFISLTGRHLLRPLSWAPLRVGKVDFTPVVAIGLVFFCAGIAERALTVLYQRLAL